LEDKKARHLAEDEALHHRNHQLVIKHEMALRSAVNFWSNYKREAKDKEEALGLWDEA